MPELKFKPVEYALLCDYAILSVDRKLSAVGIFESLAGKELPLVHPQMSVITKMILPEGKHNISMSLMQDDKVLAKFEAEKEITQKIAPNTHIWQIRNLKIDEWKPMELHILLGGKQVYIKRIPIIQVKPKAEGEN